MTTSIDPQTDPLEGVDPQHILFLTTWAARHGAVVDFAGHCGFGRDCVGVKIGDVYLDYEHLFDLFEHDTDECDLWWTPEDAYHKHCCMAVLGRGPDAVGQLYEWAKHLDEHGWTVTNEYREPKDALDAVFHGLNTPRLMPPAADGTAERERLVHEDPVLAEQAVDPDGLLAPETAETGFRRLPDGRLSLPDGSPTGYDADFQWLYEGLAGSALMLGNAITRWLQGGG